MLHLMFSLYIFVVMFWVLIFLLMELDKNLADNNETVFYKLMGAFLWPITLPAAILTIYMQHKQEKEN